ncbi:hypothetical protein [Streptomyces europaeiscabiei]|nr:hypothetical protein [Streptomyces europaeiscabiei]MDX3848506.1 hypothetical protein [Streptomyces europaeiscabiei]
MRLEGVAAGVVCEVGEGSCSGGYGGDWAGVVGALPAGENESAGV